MDHLGYFDLIDRYIDFIRNHGGMEADPYFEGVHESFDAVSHTYVNWEVKAEWDAFVERGTPLVIVRSYEREEDRAFALNTDAFSVIVDYIALQYWKNGKGMVAHMTEAHAWMDALLRGLGCLEDLLQMVHLHHPIVEEMLRMGETEREAKREAERCGRAMERCRRIEEELLMRCWHPSRVARLMGLGYAADEI